ncbi:MAG TPA: DUF5666 domain-containing protein [Pseudonocardiaceae bacterium]|jgi:hypothetical protein|nr:DUF5666 domain-containing protein [Pseudonocardiaceae bacterium]
MVNRKTMLVTGAAALALLGIGGGVALADTASSTTPSTSGEQSQTKHHKGLLAHTAHGQLTLNGPKHQVVDVQRGEVQSVDGKSITVKSSDGFTATYTVDSNTKVRKDKKTAAISQVATGDQVLVMADKNGSADTAKRIADRGPAKR